MLLNDDADESLVELLKSKENTQHADLGLYYETDKKSLVMDVCSTDLAVSDYSA